MKTKGVIVFMGLLVLACWVLLAPNTSFAGDSDKGSFWAPVMQANFDKDKDWGRPDTTPNWFNPSRFIRFYGGKDSDQGDQGQDKDKGNHNGWERGNHYGWGNGHHHHHPSASK